MKKILREIELLFNNVGGKIKTLAKVLFLVITISGLIAGVVLLTNGRSDYGDFEYITEDDMIGWLCLLAAVLGPIYTWFIYAFGQMTEDIHSMTAAKCRNDETIEIEDFEQCSLEDLDFTVWQCCDRCKNGLAPEDVLGCRFNYNGKEYTKKLCRDCYEKIKIGKIKKWD